MTPEELRAAVRERLAKRWPGVSIDMGVTPIGPHYRATVEVGVSIVGRLGASDPYDVDPVDVALLIHGLDMALRNEVSRRGLFAATREAAEGRKP